jgi:hypothetical protein
MGVTTSSAFDFSQRNHTAKYEDPAFVNLPATQLTPAFDIYSLGVIMKDDIGKKFKSSDLQKLAEECQAKPIEQRIKLSAIIDRLETLCQNLRSSSVSNRT